MSKPPEKDEKFANFKKIGNFSCANREKRMESTVIPHLFEDQNVRKAFPGLSSFPDAKLFAFKYPYD
jgi:hypothetical protein